MNTLAEIQDFVSHTAIRYHQLYPQDHIFQFGILDYSLFMLMYAKRFFVQRGLLSSREDVQHFQKLMFASNGRYFGSRVRALVEDGLDVDKAIARESENAEGYLLPILISKYREQWKREFNYREEVCHEINKELLRSASMKQQSTTPTQQLVSTMPPSRADHGQLEQDFDFSELMNQLKDIM